MGYKFRLCGFADEADPMVTGQIEALKANGMSLIEIRGIDGTNVAKITPEKAKELRSRLDDAGIRIWSVGSPIGKVDISSPEADETDRFMRILETAVITGAENIRLFSFYGTDGDPKYFDEVVRRLEIMSSRAAGTGIDLCHENEKGIYGDVASRCAEIHKACPGIRAVFDSANFIQCGQDIPEAWNLLKPYVKYCHVKDSLPDGRIVPAGEGISDYARLIPEFAGAGVGVLTLEPHLKVFKGLEALEGGARPAVGEIRTFESGRAAFDFAVRSIRKFF